MVEGYLPPEAIAAAAALGQTQGDQSRRSSRVHIGLGSLAGRRRHQRARRRVRSARRGRAWRSGSSPTRSTQRRTGASRTRVASGTCRPTPSTSRIRRRPAAPTRAARWPRSSTTRRPASAASVFATANAGPAAKASAIDALVAAGVKVIADDTSYIDRAVLPGRRDRAGSRPRQGRGRRRTSSSAGNDARQSWEGTFTPSGAMRGLRPVGRGRHDAVGRARSGRTSSVDVVLQWAEPWGARRRRLRARRLRHRRRARPSWSRRSTRTTSRRAFPRSSCAVTRGRRRDDSGSRSAASRARAARFMKFIALTNGARRSSIEHPADVGDDRPRRRVRAAAR